MIRDVFTNKIIIGAAFLLLIFAAGCYWYYQYTTAHDRAEAKKTDKLLKQWEADKKAKPTTPAETASPQTLVESTTPTTKETPTDTTRDINENIGKKKNDNGVIAHTPTETVRMSPHGFGPFPSVPDEYRKEVGIPTWIP